MIYDIRIILSLVLLFCSMCSLFLFIFSLQPIKKIINLAITYSTLLLFVIYTVFMTEIEETTLNFLIMVFVSFILNLTLGISIINNILKAKENDDN